MNMTREIPKVIHYCWFGGNPLPESAVRCIESWRRYFPDWEIKEWNESNFDVHAVPYISEAYDAKKYAFVSDYARFKILYEEGGLYFDTDVEVIAPMDDIVARGSFMGCEKAYVAGCDAMSMMVNPGLGMGALPGMPFYREMLDTYAALHFIDSSGRINKKTVVIYTTEALCKHGLVNSPEVQTVADINIYPADYFCPINYDTLVYSPTSNTRSIHHYASTWISPEDKRTKYWKRRITFLPEALAWKVARLLAILRL